jgi:hypothetical protein
MQAQCLWAFLVDDLPSVYDLGRTAHHPEQPEQQKDRNGTGGIGQSPDRGKVQQDRGVLGVMGVMASSDRGCHILFGVVFNGKQPSQREAQPMSRDRPHPREVEPHPEDVRDGEWSRVRLQRMDHKFSEAMKRAQQQAQVAAKKDNK